MDKRVGINTLFLPSKEKEFHVLLREVMIREILLPSALFRLWSSYMNWHLTLPTFILID